MKVCICCSLSQTEKVLDLAKKLEELGYEVLLPNGVINRLYDRSDFDPIRDKIGTNAIKNHIEKIKESDAVLICNYDKGDAANYIGANTFLEMAFAYYFEKPIYSINPLPDQLYIHDEIQSLDVTVLNGDLSKIH